MGAWLTSFGPFVHRIDPVMLELGGIRLWYYGLAYAAGFLGVYLWLGRRQPDLAWTHEEVYEGSLCLAVCALAVGHAFEVLVYEWPYYRDHPADLLSFQRGGMATHGVLLGAALGTWLFCRWRAKDFLRLADELAIPGAFFMAVGRIGNFINGENYGPVTAVWWAVKFPYADGFRHPVDLYDALKNLAIIPIILLVRRTPGRRRGMLLAHFVFWYGFLRLLIDLFRDYGANFLGIGRGQYFNLAMAVAGLALMLWFSLAGRRPRLPDPRSHDTRACSAPRLWPMRLAFAMLLLFSLTIPSGWSQGWLAGLRARQAADPHNPHRSLTSGQELRSLRTMSPAPMVEAR